ncbi:MAG TPA: glycosyltransferase family 4 protein [Solirubrobacterales bacterium]|nr:glycosyltransferase family 4 protein [Solirubrobacterales bacterium]
MAAEELRAWLACDWFVKYTAGLAQGLAENGCEVTLLTRDHDQEFGDEPGAMRSFLAGAADVRHLELRGRVRERVGLRDTARFARERRRFAPAVVHLQDSVTNDLRLALASGLPRSRYALTVHDPVPHPGDEVHPLVLKKVRRALRRGASLVFVHSEALAEELGATGDVKAPIEVVPHGAAAAPFRPPPADSLLFFGRMSYYKGLDVLLDAMAAVWRERPQVKLTVAGEGEWPRHPVLDDPRVTARDEHVPEGEVGRLYEGATCVVLPYRQASQSGVGSLAMEHGRALIATRVGGLPELVGADRGRLVRSEDPAALAVAILEVLSTDGLAERLGRGATAAVEREIGWKAVAARTIAAYRRHLLTADLS